MARHIPYLGEGAAAVAVGAGALAVLVVIGVVPGGSRPAVSGALGGAAAALFLLATVLVHHAHRASRQARPAGASGGWFGPASGYPADALRALGADPDAPELHTAWLLARQGHHAAWIMRHLDLRPELAHLLVDRANR